MKVRKRGKLETQREACQKLHGMNVSTAVHSKLLALRVKLQREFLDLMPGLPAKFSMSDIVSYLLTSYSAYEEEKSMRGIGGPIVPFQTPGALWICPHHPLGRDQPCDLCSQSPKE